MVLIQGYCPLPVCRKRFQKNPSSVCRKVTTYSGVNACIDGYGKGFTSSPFDYAGPFTESILIGNLALRAFTMKNPNGKGWDDKYLGRKKLLWDAKNLKVTNFDAANQWVKREYREGWKLGS
jgi:hypothetical protein